MIFIFIGIAAAVFAADLVIKSRVEKSGGLPRNVWKGRIVLQKYHNKGAMLNFGEKKQGLVAAASVLLTFLVLAVFILSFGQRGNNLLRTGLALLLGGAFSNTYDRLKRRYVVDYISFQVKWKRFADIVFNLSDFCIMVGAMISCLAAK
ncbi:MAG: signal peptidase II [Lachnospiraceae bacterium]|nr:signal peptidase II [Lachnospiraceae bacterium]